MELSKLFFEIMVDIDTAYIYSNDAPTFVVMPFIKHNDHTVHEKSVQVN